jgi:hypothetical protein
MDESSGNHELCPPGIGGPRRSTQEPLETAAANAEAARMADELGVSSSVRLNSVRREEEAASAGGGASQKRRGFKLFGRTSTEGSMEDETKAYQAMPADGSTTGVGLINRQTATSTSFSSVAMKNNHTQQQPTYAQTGSFVNANHLFEDDDATIRTDGPHLFDENGHRAPYREGPYDFHHEEDGRLIKKRWCKCTARLGSKVHCTLSKGSLISCFPFKIDRRANGGWLFGMVVDLFT